MGSNDCRFGNVEWGLGNCHLQFYQLEFHLVHREKRKVRKAPLQYLMNNGCQQGRLKIFLAFLGLERSGRLGMSDGR